MVFTIFIRFIVLILRRHTIITFLILFMFTIHFLFSQERIKTDVFGLDVLSIHTVWTFAIWTMFTLPFLYFINIILEINNTIQTFTTSTMITFISNITFIFTFFLHFLLIFYFRLSLFLSHSPLCP